MLKNAHVADAGFEPVIRKMELKMGVRVLPCAPSGEARPESAPRSQRKNGGSDPSRGCQMANIKKGQLVRPPEWWKHLRWSKRVFWKKHRKAEQRLVRRCSGETGTR